jgi:hypothetical protein
MEKCNGIYPEFAKVVQKPIILQANGHRDDLWRTIEACSQEHGGSVHLISMEQKQPDPVNAGNSKRNHCHS